MLIAIIALAAILIFAYIILKVKNNLQIAVILIIVCLISTIYFCLAKPVLHKPFSINIIDYVIKFNTDGSMTTTKQTTTTVIKEESK